MNDLKFNRVVELMRGDAVRAAKYAQEDKQARLVAFERAKQVRPYFVEAQLALDGVAGKQRTAYTEAQEFDLLVVGAITSHDSLRYAIDTIGGGRKWSLEAIPSWAAAGLATNASGTNGPFYFPVPYRLKARNKMAVEITNTPGLNNQTASVVFLCARVLATTDKEGQVDTAADIRAIAAINSAEEQRTVFLRMGVPFASGGGSIQKNKKTLEEDTPLLVTAISTDLQSCTIRITDPSSNLWSPTEIPIWSIAGNYQAEKGGWRHLRRPFYLPPNTVLRADLTDGINGVTDAIDGEIIFLCTTP